jgi:hypothetical protein
MSASEGVLYLWEAFYAVSAGKKQRSSRMNRMIRFISIIVPLIVMVSSCSTMRTEKSADSFSSLADNQPYQIRVRSGHSIMDRIIYESALLEFGKYLAISETDSYRGTIEIIFAGTSDSSFLDSTTDFSTSSVAGNAWYIGTDYIRLSGSDSAHEAGSPSATTVMPEKSTMHVDIKGSHAKSLWTADYKYKRDLELSGFATDTEEKAARLCVKRIVEKLTDDFPAIRESTR